jgi:phage-related protein
MNGRIYDPLLGRFLSADIVVQAPGFLQSYNRYSYVMNNPLTLTDPSGFFWDPDSGWWGAKEWGIFGKAAVVEPVVDGYKSGAAHMESGFQEIANADGVLDATIGTLHVVAAVGDAVGTALQVTPSGKAEQALVKGGEKLMAKLGGEAAQVAEQKVAQAVNAAAKLEGKAASVEKRVEGVVAQSDGKVSKAAPTVEAKGTAKQETGSYTNHHESGKTYDGKGSKERSQTSAKRVEKETGDKHVATEWTPSKTEREAFKDESKRLDSHGGAKSENNHNKIESPGKKKRIEDGEI